MSNNDWLKHYGVKGMKWRNKRGTLETKNYNRSSADARKMLLELNMSAKRNHNRSDRLKKTRFNSTKRTREKDHNSVVNRVKRFSANVAKTSKATVNRGYNALQSILKKYR